MEAPIIAAISLAPIALLGYAVYRIWKQVDHIAATMAVSLPAVSEPEHKPEHN